MKKLLLIAALSAATVGVLAADGQVNFNNRVTTANIDAPISNVGGAKLEGAGFLAQLYIGDTEASLAPVAGTATFRTGAGAGYITGGGARTIVGSDGVKVYKAQVRAWDAAGGATFEAAVGAGKNAGKSNVLNVTPTVAPNPPADLVGLQAFSLAGGTPVIPEPSTIALSLLGLGALLAWRRK